MKSKAEFKIEDLPENTLLSISGILDEYATFPDIPGSEYRDLLIDLNELQSMNSVGINSWMEWFTTLSFRRVTFRKCPRVFIDQVNNVLGFIPDNSTIISFYVPYYSEANEEDAQILFVRGEHFQAGKILQLPYVLDSQSVQMEVDVIMEKYLRFLPRFTR